MVVQLSMRQWEHCRKLSNCVSQCMILFGFVVDLMRDPYIRSNKPLVAALSCIEEWSFNLEFKSQARPHTPSICLEIATFAIVRTMFLNSKMLTDSLTALRFTLCCGMCWWLCRFKPFCHWVFATLTSFNVFSSSSYWSIPGISTQLQIPPIPDDKPRWFQVPLYYVAVNILSRMSNASPNNCRT